MTGSEKRLLILLSMYWDFNRNFIASDLIENEKMRNSYAHLEKEMWNLIQLENSDYELNVTDITTEKEKQTHFVLALKRLYKALSIYSNMKTVLDIQEIIHAGTDVANSYNDLYTSFSQLIEKERRNLREIRRRNNI